MPYHVPTPIPIARVVATIAMATFTPGWVVWAAIPMAPATANPEMIGQAFVVDAFPRNQPISNTTKKMLIARTALSAVPNVEMANVFNHFGETSMTYVPMAEIEEGTESESPANS